MAEIMPLWGVAVLALMKQDVCLNFCRLLQRNDDAVGMVRLERCQRILHFQWTNTGL